MGLYGTGCKVLEQCRWMKGNTRETYVRGTKCEEKGGECRGITLECMVVGEKCQGKQVNGREMYGSGCKVPVECIGVCAKYHGEWSGCKVPGECRGMSGKRTVVGAKCQGKARECMCGCKESTNAGECTGIPGKK